MGTNSKSDSPFTMKVLSTRHRKEDPIADAAGMLRLIRQLRGDALIPKGVYRFKTMDEADQWMTQKIANTHAHLSLKT